MGAKQIPREDNAGGNEQSNGQGMKEYRLFNRELGWIEFNARVLEEGLDCSLPLLERLKFLSISASNLDEFFEVRVASLVQQIEDGYNEGAADGLTLVAAASARVAPSIAKLSAMLSERADDVVVAIAMIAMGASFFRRQCPCVSVVNTTGSALFPSKLPAWTGPLLRPRRKGEAAVRSRR